MGNQNDILGPTGGAPSVRDGASFANLTAAANYQIKAAAGILQRLGVNTGASTAEISLYDGLSAVVTMTIASPAVVTWPAGQKPAAGTAVKFTNAGGALPTGITADTTYYVSTAGATSIAAQIADTQAHALAGTNSINTSESQSGVQTAWNVGTPIGTYDASAQDSVEIGAYFASGLIAIVSEAPDVTVLYN